MCSSTTTDNYIVSAGVVLILLALLTTPATSISRSTVYLSPANNIQPTRTRRAEEHARFLRCAFCNQSLTHLLTHVQVI